METDSLLHATEARIGKLVVLPWKKAMEIAVKSIRVRFWRSMITMSSIILAIAFLMSIWTTTCLTTRLVQTAQTREALRALLVQSGFQVAAEERPRASRLLRYLPSSLSQMIASTGTKDKWLISLSLLVCVVGIVNAMLMSVTERFREIGTMKCLGALDKFIVRIFLLESSGLGVIGTALGILVGFVLTMVRFTLTLGIYPWKYFPGAQILQSALISLVAGTLLSVLAAIYPAWTAAKMEPVAAMRLEQ